MIMGGGGMPGLSPEEAVEVLPTADGGDDARLTSGASEAGGEAAGQAVARTREWHAAPRPRSLRRRGLSRDVLDASVLASPPVAELLLRLARAPEVPFTPLWSKKILSEAYQLHIGPDVRWDPRLARRFQAALLGHFPHSRVVRYGRWLAHCPNAPAARHVLACAITGRADTIVTYLPGRFEVGFEYWPVRIVHPQDFLLRLYTLFPERILRELHKIARKHSRQLNRYVTVEDELVALAPCAPEFARTLGATLGYVS